VGNSIPNLHLTSNLNPNPRNGLRAVGLFVYERGGASRSFVIDTLAGPRHVTVHETQLVSVEMGRAKLLETDASCEGRKWQRVSMGNPHAMTVVDNVQNVELEGFFCLLFACFSEQKDVKSAWKSCGSRMGHQR
jgi:diaminopimelate epimerase